MILSGWKSIAAHLGAGVRTVQRWEHAGLPVRRPRGSTKGPILAYSEEVDAWVKHHHDGADGETPMRVSLQARLDSIRLSRQAAALLEELDRNSQELRNQLERMKSLIALRRGANGNGHNGAGLSPGRLSANGDGGNSRPHRDHEHDGLPQSKSER